MRFVIYSDEDIQVPSKLGPIEIRLIDRNTYGQGFSTKLHLDTFAPSAQSLFIDADCLIFSSLEPLFSAFSGSAVGVLGYMKAEGEMFGDVSSVCQKVGVKALPHFNGGIYYVEAGEKTKGVFREARRLEPEYDSLGLVRLRGQPNDEMLIGIALAKAGIAPVANDGRYYADFQWWPRVDELDVLAGKARLRNPPAGSVDHQDRFPATEAAPIVVHFLGHHAEGPYYKREVVALRRGRVLAEVYGIYLFFALRLRNWLRPLFRRVFGVRRIKRTESRLIVD